MNFRRTSPHDAPEINLIPLIDILLVILIFLLLSTSFIRINALRVQLPDGQPLSEKENTKTIQVNLSSTGQVAINNHFMESPNITNLAQALATEAGTNASNITVTIHADAQASHQAVIHVMEAARKAGLARVSFATQDPAR